MIHAILLSLCLPGQVIVAADDSPRRWQDRAEFHCRDEVDDAIVIKRAVEVAERDKEVLVFGPGNYENGSTIKIGPGVTGVSGVGASLNASWRVPFEGEWLMIVRGVYRASIEGMTFSPRKKAKGLLLDDCADSKVRRLKFSGCVQALRVDQGHCLYLSAMRVNWCRRPNDPLTEPIVELNGFGSSSFCGIAFGRCETTAPILAINGGKGTFSEINIERCQSDDSMVRIRGTHATLGPFHFEGNEAPVQIRGVDCRQVKIHGLSCGNDRADPVEVGVLLTRCRDTLVDSVIVTYCRDALVRIGPKCWGCEAKRIDLYYTDRSVYDGVNGRVLPRHIIDYQGSH
jgi:hypothetical protein